MFTGWRNRMKAGWKYAAIGFILELIVILGTGNFIGKKQIEEEIPETHQQDEAGQPDTERPTPSPIGDSILEEGFKISQSTIESSELQLPKVVWEEIICSEGEAYRVSFERISALYDAESELYPYCADYQLIVRDSDGKDISKQTIVNFPVWYEEAHWMADVSGDGFSDVVLCSFYEGFTRATELCFYIWNMNKRGYEEQPLPWHLWMPVWNEKLSCVIFTDESYDDICMKMVSLENGEWKLRGELLFEEITEETEETVQFQYKEIFYTEEGNIENKIIVNIPEENMPWHDVNSVWCDDNSQNEYLNLGSLDWDIVDIELEEGKSSPKYIRR